MYRDMLNVFGREKLYLAGPECFYTNGYTLWDAFRRKAEACGFGVSMPSDNKLELSETDLQANARTIFRNCARCMNESTAILVDLENFRGSEPDGGSIYELGMAYARGLRCYAFTRDKRATVWKHPGARVLGGTVCDADGRALPYPDLPFAPSIVGACRIAEGGFDDCLKLLMLDIERKSVDGALGVRRIVSPIPDPEPHARPRLYLAGPERYDADCVNIYEQMRAACAALGYEAVTPLDPARGEPAAQAGNPFAAAALPFYRMQQHVRDCDVILANLNDFRGYEPSNDVSFECGMGFQLGKKLVGYLADARIMKERIPNYGAELEFRDECGRNAENFDYPVNLMFAGSMPILEGTDFSEILRAADGLLRQA